MLPAFLLPAISTSGLTVCVRLPAACFLANCQYNSRFQGLSPSTCCLPTSSTPCLKVCFRPRAACHPSTSHLNSRSQGLCPSTCCLPCCYLPVQNQVSQSVSVYLLSAFLLPASTNPALTVCVRIASVSLPCTCQFNTRSHSLCPYSSCVTSCNLSV